MATDTEPGKDSHATLWQVLCWMAYNDFDAYDPDGDGSLHQDIKLAYDTSGHKASLLEAARDGKVSFEGRLGIHCDPPPTIGNTWRDLHRAGHSSEHSPIEPKDWPGQYNDVVIGWESSTLLTERGEFVDVRVSKVIVRAWHPSPASQVAKRQIPLAEQALETGHQMLKEADLPQRTPSDDGIDQEGKPKRKRDVEADARLENKIRTVLAVARRKWPDPEKQPEIDVMAKELERLHRKEPGYSFERVRKILRGTYTSSVRLGIPGL